ncbi:ATP-grasp domain-containing protein [Peribacillus kribbensis]|uniref:ATP-grasp domain-containing protein n=1 Tax=Peribacillus kribbensis TaxID=356658 RepID=UPI000414037D|nr:ATP-grasp domain-containing protein [Peribacillus kribbensis]
MKKKGWLIYNKEDSSRNSVFIERLLKEAELLGTGLEFMVKESFTIGVKQHALLLLYNGKQVELPQFAIMRNIDELFTAQLELMGCRVYNSSYISRIANDKARTHQLLASKGFPMADTYFLGPEFDFFCPGDFPVPCVVKEVQGRGGKEVFRVNSHEELQDVFTQSRGKKVILQKLEKPGKDVRVFVVGKKIVAAVLRESHHDFRSNHSLGGSSGMYDLSPSQVKMVNGIIDLFDFGMAGIDFIFNEDGNFLFNEIEDVVGSRTLSLNSDINIVRILLEYVLKDLSGERADE